MATSLCLAFALAVVLCIAFTPLARSAAMRTGFVDQPSSRKIHTEPVSYLGGLALGFAAILTVIVVRGPMPQPLALLAGAVGLGIVGGCDDRFGVPIALRLLAEAFAALMAVLAGVRIQLTGVDVLDVALTLAWIIALTNAMNLVDNMDGLASGLAGLAGVGIAIVGGLQGQQVIAVAGAATAGACAGFLVFNWHPARIFMGDLGALFLGFLLAVLSIELQPDLPRLGSEAIPLLFLAVPLFDTATVVCGRLRHRISPTTGGKDHLSHRLHRRLGSTRGAVAVLLATQLGCGAMAVLIAVERVSPWVGSGIAGVLLLAVGALAWPINVYSPAPMAPAARAAGIGN